jgi:hypothetical protein
MHKQRKQKIMNVSYITLTAAEWLILFGILSHQGE